MSDLQNFGKNLKIQKNNNSISDMDIFIDIINLFDECNKRTEKLEQDFTIDLVIYEEPFFLLIENLLFLKYGDIKTEITLWWVYDRFNQNGELNTIKLQIEDGEEEEIVVETAKQLWDLIEKIS